MGVFDNPTQAVGVLGFAAAALASLVRWREPAWRFTALAMALLVVEVWYSGRHKLHLVLKFAAGEAYAQRRPVQAVAFVIVLVLGIVFVRHVLLRVRGGEQRLHFAALALIFGCFAAELVSLHQVDAILYKRIGGVLVVGWAWLAGALTLVALAVKPAARKGWI